MPRLALPVLAAALALVLASAPATAQEHDTLTGRVLNLSVDQPAPGLEVTLHVFSPQGSVETRTTTTGAQGEFRFESVPTGASERYAVSAAYRDITYSVEPESLQAPVVLAVFDTTNDIATLRIDSHILIVRAVDTKERTISAAEVVLLSNGGSRAFKPVLEPANAMNFLRFTVPPGTAGLEVQSNLRGGDVMDVGTGFGLTAPVPPGSHQVSFNYTFPYEGDTAALAPTFLQGASIFRVLVPGGLGEASGPGLSEAQTTAIGETTYRAWSANNLPARAKPAIKLTGLPQPTLWQGVSNALGDGRFVIIGIPSAMALAMVALLAHALTRRAPPGPLPASGPRSTSHGLALQIAQLDNAFEAGELSRAEYERDREALKRRLLAAPEENGPSPREEGPER